MIALRNLTINNYDYENKNNIINNNSHKFYESCTKHREVQYR